MDIRNDRDFVISYWGGSQYHTCCRLFILIEYIFTEFQNGLPWPLLHRIVHHLGFSCCLSIFSDAIGMVDFFRLEFFFQVTIVFRNKLWSTRNLRDGVSPEDVGHCRWTLRFHSLSLLHAYFVLPAFLYNVMTYFSWHREMYPFLNISQNKPFLL